MERRHSAALILAGGSGSRMKNNTPKQYVKLYDKPVLAHTIGPFEASNRIDEIIIAAHPDYHSEIEKLRGTYSFSKISKIVESGETRQDSSYNAIRALCCDSNSIVFIHDAARPFISLSMIEKLYDAAITHGAAVSAVPSTDTVYVSGPENFIGSIPDRSMLYNAQTPQVFTFGLIKEAHEYARKNSLGGATDDAALVLQLGCKVKIVEGEYTNIKLTTPADLDFAGRILNTFR